MIAGVIDPFFEGLRLSLFHKGNSMGPIFLSPAEDGLTAVFRDEVSLADNETNELNFEFSYDDHPLEPPLPPLVVYYDAKRPSLENDQWFEYSGVFLDVILEPTEPLKQLRIRGAVSRRSARRPSRA